MKERDILATCKSNIKDQIDLRCHRNKTLQQFSQLGNKETSRIQLFVCGIETLYQLTLLGRQGSGHQACSNDTDLRHEFHTRFVQDITYVLLVHPDRSYRRKHKSSTRTKHTTLNEASLNTCRHAILLYDVVHIETRS